MTNKEKNQIAKLRAKGVGYKRIADQLRLSVSTVKSYCQRNNLSAPATPPKPVIALSSDILAHSLQSMENPYACRQCGIHIEQAQGRKLKRFCSTACRMKWWRQHKAEMRHDAAHTALCAECGVAFTYYGNVERKYCSRDCYMNHRFRNGSESS